MATAAHRWKRSSTARHGNHGGLRSEVVTLADLEKELNRLHESKALLVSTAGKLGMAVPRSCCPHTGETACVSCSADWLVAHVRFANGAVPTAYVEVTNH
jgi:hypothetical protein